MSFIDRCLSIYRQDGLTTLFKRALQKIQQDIYCKWASIHGHYTLALNGTSVSFSAPNPTIVRRTRNRFSSEEEELEDFVNEIEDDDVVYDIGANTGIYTLFAAKKCPNGKVIAFEPYPPNINILKRDIRRNNIGNIDVFDIALSDSTGRIQFNQPDDDDIGYGSSSIEADGSEDTIEVPTTTGDKLIADNKIPYPNIVKIDVEGAEPLVIDGLEDALSSESCRTVYCEVHLSGVDYRSSIEDFGVTPEDIKVKLEDFGFNVENLQSNRDHEIFYKAYK